MDKGDTHVTCDCHGCIFATSGKNKEGHVAVTEIMVPVNIGHEAYCESGFGETACPIVMEEETTLSFGFETCTRVPPRTHPGPFVLIHEGTNAEDSCHRNGVVTVRCSLVDADTTIGAFDSGAVYVSGPLYEIGTFHKCFPAKHILIRLCSPTLLD